jgi:hypothetical protein
VIAAGAAHLGARSRASCPAIRSPAPSIRARRPRSRRSFAIATSC